MYLQHSAHATESKLISMLFDKHKLHSKTLAKYTAAFFRMSHSLVIRLSYALSFVISACRALRLSIGGSLGPLSLRVYV